MKRRDFSEINRKQAKQSRVFFGGGGMGAAMAGAVAAALRPTVRPCTCAGGFRYPDGAYTWPPTCLICGGVL